MRLRKKNVYTQNNNQIFPYEEIENFKTDSSNLNLDVTLMNISVDNKNIILKCFDDSGVKLKKLKKIKKEDLLNG